MLLNCHNARFAYNWAVARIKECLENKQPIPSKYTLATEFAKFKKQPGYEWLVQKPASQRATKLAITNSISMGMTKFYLGQHQPPAFHRRKCAKMSYYSHEGTTLYENNRVRLENLGWVNCRNNLPLDDNIEICAPCVIFTGDYWELSCCLKYKTPVKPKYHHSDVDIHHQPIGIDVGVTHMAVTSDGDFYDIPTEKLKKIDKRIARVDRRIDRIRNMNKKVMQTCDTKTKYPEYEVKSQNLLKLESKRRKLYKRHADIRKDIRCQAVADIVKKYPSAIVIEDIKDPRASWMIKGAHKFNKRINDVAIGDFLTRLKYKCAWLDIPLIIADKAYPSTKTCSCCGNVLDNQLTKDRMFICSVCGYEEDRDINAAINLRNLATNEPEEEFEYEFDYDVA